MKGLSNRHTMAICKFNNDLANK